MRWPTGGRAALHALGRDWQRHSADAAQHTVEHHRRQADTATVDASRWHRTVAQLCTEAQLRAGRDPLLARVEDLDRAVHAAAVRHTDTGRPADVAHERHRVAVERGPSLGR
jgi:hypothetical protein